MTLTWYATAHATEVYGNIELKLRFSQNQRFPSDAIQTLISSLQDNVYTQLEHHCVAQDFYFYVKSLAKFDKKVQQVPFSYSRSHMTNIVTAPWNFDITSITCNIPWNCNHPRVKLKQINRMYL